MRSRPEKHVKDPTNATKDVDVLKLLERPQLLVSDLEILCESLEHNRVQGILVLRSLSFPSDEKKSVY